MNTLDKQYTDLLQDILDNGVTKQDRTGTGTLSVFGRQIRHKMADGFPLLTTKKMPFRLIATEMLWFLRGDTNIKYLVDNGCHIWDGDAYKAYEKWYEHMSKTTPFDVPKKFTQDELIKSISLDKWHADQFGDLGPVYGKQWRDWQDDFGPNRLPLFPPNNKIDQIANLIRDLKINPDSRRLMVNAWNVGELDQMVLPPCHYGFQVYTRELSFAERVRYYETTFGRLHFIPPSPDALDARNIPTRAISLMWNQRSVDTFLGLPFNIASYGLLLEIIAKEVNMIPDELIGNLGDTHLYLDHIEQAKEQIGREYDHEERHEMLKVAMGPLRYQSAVDEQVPFGGGLSEYYDIYKVPHKKREPYPLPTLKHMKTEEFYKALSEDVSLFTHLDPTDFQVENYQAHPHIKAPLSN
jgi:thymidylate synthase